jgi:hypothetical protein
LPTKRDLKRNLSCDLGVGDGVSQGFPPGLQARPFFDDKIERGERIVGWHGIAGVGDARIPDGVREIDVSERFRDVLMGDAHRLGPVLGRQGERGFQHLARGPAGISNVRASFLSGHVCLLLYRMSESPGTTVYATKVMSARIPFRGVSPLHARGKSHLAV